MNKRLIRQIILWGVLHLLVTLAVDFAIFALSHLPPQHYDLSQPILWLSRIYAILIWPRKGLRLLWPFESTPLLVIYLVWAGNSLLWGGAVALFVKWRGQPRTRS